MTPSLSDRSNILIVDDQLDNLRLLAEILTVEGYKVRKVMDGIRALDAAQLAPPDLILLDIMMPIIDGYEVCHQLKVDPRTQDIPVIFLSALNDLGDKIKAFSGGGVDYIAKPFQKDEVLARVKTHLNLQRLTKTLQCQNTQLAEEIEHRKAAEDELKQALADLNAAQAQIIAREKLAALGNLTAGIAHELRNPLNFVNNYAEGSLEITDELLINLERLDSEAAIAIKDLLVDLKENALSIYQHGQRAEQIINSMMQHARMKASAPQATNLNHLLGEAIDLAYHSKRVQSFDFTATLEKDYDPELQLCKCLAAELCRAFINLIDNAFYEIEKKRHRLGYEFTPKVSIKTRQLGDIIEIHIRDNGMGIHSGDHDKIFEPFFTTKPAGEGMGLGLSMTHEIIVSQHGGTLRVNSEPGVFTEFVVTLPVG
jgi:signal transduction histidine kinase